MASECRDGSQGSADLPGGDAGSLARFGRAVRPPGGLRRLLVHVVETAAVRVQEGKRRTAGGVSGLPEAEAYSGCFRLDRPRLCVPEVGIPGSGTPFPDPSHHAVLDQERRSVKDILGVLVRAGMPPKKVAFVGFFKGGAMVSQARASTTTVAALLLVTASCAAQRPPVETGP